MEAKFLEQFKEVLGIENREIKLQDEFRQYEEWDSMAGLSVIAMMDDEFGVMLSSSDFGKLRTVGDLIEEVKRRMK